MIQADTLNK